MRIPTLKIFLVFLILYSCSTSQKKKQQVNIKTIEFQDSSKIKTPIFFKDSLRNIKDFSIQVNDFQFDEMIKNLSKNKDTKISIVQDTCIGDVCIACEEMYDSKRRTILYLLKSDAGDYGFGNAQYLFINDSLKKIRNFDFSAAEDTINSSSASFKMNEKIYVFKKNEVIISERNKIFRGDNHYTLSDTNFITRTSDLSTFIVSETEVFRLRLDFVKRLSTLRQ